MLTTLVFRGSDEDLSPIHALLGWEGVIADSSLPKKREIQIPFCKMPELVSALSAAGIFGVEMMLRCRQKKVSEVALGTGVAFWQQVCDLFEIPYPEFWNFEKAVAQILTRLAAELEDLS